MNAIPESVIVMGRPPRSGGWMGWWVEKRDARFSSDAWLFNQVLDWSFSCFIHQLVFLPILLIIYLLVFCFSTVFIISGSLIDYLNGLLPYLISWNRQLARLIKGKWGNAHSDTKKMTSSWLSISSLHWQKQNTITKRYSK